MTIYALKKRKIEERCEFNRIFIILRHITMGNDGEKVEVRADHCQFMRTHNFFLMCHFVSCECAKKLKIQCSSSLPYIYFAKCSPSKFIILVELSNSNAKFINAWVNQQTFTYVSHDMKGSCKLNVTNNWHEWWHMEEVLNWSDEKNVHYRQITSLS